MFPKDICFCFLAYTEVSVENLRDEEQVGDEGSLKNDGDVGSVEQLDWVWLSLALNSVALDSKINSESLEKKLINVLK